MCCPPLLQGRIFGDTFPLAAAGAGGLPPDALVPGIAVFSRRAEALAAWTSGVELASVSADTDRACLILETGVNERFRCFTRGMHAARNSLRHHAMLWPHRCATACQATC